MTWLDPWAWWGLAALAVPVAIHLLTRAQPTPQPFPTLRFLTQATSTAVRRRRLEDRGLLAVRLGILAAIVAALAQPTIGRAGSGAAAPVVRAVVMDARVPADAARARVTHITPPAAASVSITADHLGPAIARAATWLGQRGGRGELVVVSAFRRGDLEQVDLTPAAPPTGIRLIKVDVAPEAATALPAQRVADRLWSPRLTLDADRTRVTWTPAAAGSTPPSFLRVMASEADRDRVSAALNAASVVGVPVAGAHPIAIVLPGAPEEASAVAGARALDEPWMFDVVDALRRDPVVAAACLRAASSSSAHPLTSATTIARDANGAPLVDAVSGATASGRELRVVLRTRDALVLSAVVAGAARSAIDPAALRQLEPVSLTADELGRWERPLPATGAPAKSPAAGDWQGRWFWIAALALFALETWMRRTTTPPAAAEVRHARVA